MKKVQKPTDEELQKSEVTSKKLSRRGFLKGAGLTTAGTVMATSGVLGFQETVEKSKTLGPDSVHVQLKINGRNYEAVIEPRVTLADLLRDQLQLTGTKVVCDRGSCSACTVWVNDIPVNSCLTLAMDVLNDEITTIEGLAQNGELHPVQEAFITHDATQCGYCTPGMVMSSAHLLNKNPNPSMKEVKEAVNGNLCRCGTHPHVFKAVLDASKKM